MFSKLAPERRQAMATCPDVGFAGPNHGAGLVDDPLTLKHQPENVGGDIGVDKAGLEDLPIRAEWPLNVPDDDRRNADVGAAQHPSLGGRIEQLIGLHAARILDLGQPPAAPTVRFKNVGADYHAV